MNKPTIMIIVTNLSEPHIYVMYANSVCLSVSPYVHNTIIYKCSANSRSTFNCWLQLYKETLSALFLYQQTCHDKQTNILPIAPCYANCYVMLTETFSMYCRIVFVIMKLLWFVNKPNWKPWRYMFAFSEKLFCLLLCELIRG